MQEGVVSECVSLAFRREMGKWRMESLKKSLDAHSDFLFSVYLQQGISASVKLWIFTF